MVHPDFLPQESSEVTESSQSLSEQHISVLPTLHSSPSQQPVTDSSSRTIILPTTAISSVQDSTLTSNLFPTQAMNPMPLVKSPVPKQKNVLKERFVLKNTHVVQQAKVINLRAFINSLKTFVFTKICNKEYKMSIKTYF